MSGPLDGVRMGPGDDQVSGEVAELRREGA